MKLFLTFLSSVVIAGPVHAAFFTNSPDADAFVRAAAGATNLNYGLAGALSVSGASSTNPTSGITNGVFDTFIRFSTAAVTNFNLLFGSNNWVITSATLQVTAQAPNNGIFNNGAGTFQIFWITNNNWTEGTGTPSTPTMNGICYTNEPTLLDSNSNVSLGTFSYSGATSGVLNFSLALPAAFVNAVSAGGEVGFYLTAASPGIGCVFTSRNFPTSPAAWPYLKISAVPVPGISGVNLSGTNVALSATNGAAGGTYYVLSSTNTVLPLSQWLPVATNVLAGNGNFIITVTNAMNAGTPGQQFFILQTQ
jgi:hypothetical protein